ncbi:MAG: PAS domain S-box protein, partial [Solirubrobacteraceae bacterium]
MATRTLRTTPARPRSAASQQGPPEKDPGRLDSASRRQAAAQEQLLGSLAELRERLAVFDRIPDVGSWTWDPGRERLDVSPRFIGMLDLSGSTALRMEHALAAMPEEDAALVRDALRGLLRGEVESCRLNYRLRGAGEVMHSFEGHCLAIRDQLGRTGKVLGVAKNVTARREAERAAALHGEMHAEVDAAVMMLDTDTRILAWTEGAERLYGWPREEVIGRTAPEV